MTLSQIPNLINRWRFSGPKAVLAMLLLFSLVILLRNAWVAEDAYITFRVIDNFFAGYGLRWNVVERVQVFTHPLWLLLLTFGFSLTQELYFTSIIFSLAATVATLALIGYRRARSWQLAVLGIGTLIVSKAFVDFSTSGLENALTHLLLVLFVVVYLAAPRTPRRLFYLSLIASLAALNRLDVVLLYGPALIAMLFTLRRWRDAWPLLLGSLPLVAWQLFALLYYGFPFPNTAYAKLSHGVPAPELWQQGFYYLFNSLTLDPVTLWMITAGIVIPLVTWQKRQLPLVVGMVLYLLYVVKIGGDFMSGRFLTAPLVLAVALLVGNRRLASSASLVWVLLGLALLFGLGADRSPVFSEVDYAEQPRVQEVPRGIADERAFYYGAMGLLRVPFHNDMVPNHLFAHNGIGWRDSGSRGVVISTTIGIFGYYAGPTAFILDPMALSDPLLARLPFNRAHHDQFSGRNWRIGHFARLMPAGYLETVEHGTNLIIDPDLAVYHDTLSLVTRGPLLGRQRLRAMWRLNTGQLDYLRQAYVDRIN